ncbi:MAG: glutamate--tRNA ligase, partial [bacterium]
KLDRETFMALMKEIQRETSVKGRALWAPMRSAITLEEQGPDLFSVVEVFGLEKTLARIDRALTGQG